MKINLTKNDLSQFSKLTRIQELNMEASDFYNSYLKGDLSYINKATIDEIIFTQGLSTNKAYLEAMRQMVDIDPEDSEFIKIIKTCRLDNIDMLLSIDYESNPYYRDISFADNKIGNWEISYNTYYPYEGFIYKDVVSTPTNLYAEYTSFGYFTSYFKYLTVMQNKQVWMSITPHEINTMQSAIDTVEGSVAVFGLGLGYFPYMISLKDSVKRIVIIEKDPSVISLFNNYILPQFSHKEKITIIQDEAFEYAHNKMNKDKFDFAFIDLWKNEFDGLSLYFRMKKNEKINTGTKFLYWIEDSLVVMIRRCLLTLIDEELGGTTDEDYLKAGNVFDKCVNRLHFILKDQEINAYEDILSLLTKDNLIKLSELV